MQAQLVIIHYIYLAMGKALTGQLWPAGYSKSQGSPLVTISRGGHQAGSRGLLGAAAVKEVSSSEGHLPGSCDLPGAAAVLLNT